MVPNGWSNGTLEDGITLLSGQHIEAQYVNSDGQGIPYLTGPADFPEGKIVVTKFTEFAKVCCEYGDHLITVKGSGTGKVITSDGAYCISRQLMAVRANSLEPSFTFYLLQKNLNRYEGAAGGLIPGIARCDVLDTPIKIPPYKEQAKIAKMLAAWDKAITTTEQLLANSQQQKKALMQKLLTGKVRFAEFVQSTAFTRNKYGLIPNDWGFVSIEMVAKSVSEKNKSDKEYPVLSCSKYHGFVESLKYFNKKVYSDDTSGYKIIRRGEFGFQSNHVEEGSIGLQNLYDIGIVSPIYIIFKADQKKIDNAYLYSLLKTDHYKQIFSASTNASVDRRGNLRWDEFGKIKIPIPSLAEQQKISSALFIADKEIEVIQAKLNVLRQEKKALMQQLLTGKRRVSVNA